MAIKVRTSRFHILGYFILASILLLVLGFYVIVSQKTDDFLEMVGALEYLLNVFVSTLLLLSIIGMVYSKIKRNKELFKGFVYSFYFSITISVLYWWLTLKY